MSRKQKRGLNLENKGIFGDEKMAKGIKPARRGIVDFAIDSLISGSSVSVKDAKEPRVERIISVDLTSELRDGLEKATREWEMEPDDIVLQALQDWLDEQGYL